MIRALLTGTLYGDPQARTSQAGKPFTTAKVRADGKDGASVWCSIIAFGEQAERLLTLKANAAVSVSGRVELSAWVGKDGAPTAGLDVVVDDLATLKGKPRPPAGDSDARPGRPGANPRPPARRAQPAPVTADALPFDDFEQWQP